MKKLLIAGLIAAALTSFADSKQQYYTRNLGSKVILYSPGSDSKPDIMEVYSNNKDSWPKEFAYMVPVAEIINDYDHDGIIGNNRSDTYTIMSEDPGDRSVYSFSGIDKSNIIEGVDKSLRKKYLHKAVIGKDLYLEDSDVILLPDDDFTEEKAQKTKKYVDEFLENITIKYNLYKSLMKI